MYNGELYQTEELYGELGRPALRGSSDTELLVEALEALGAEKTLSLLRGMFAFCAFDKKAGRLYLAVDRAGEKPLYFGFVGKSFVFGSEPSVFPLFPGFEKRINREALAAYFRYSYIPAPACIYEGIGKLGPGEMLVLEAPFNEEGLVKKKYWSMSEAAKRGEASPFKGSSRDALSELERLLSASVRGQLVSDVPLGAYLSGGIDSSLVVSLMTELSPSPVRTYTIGFSEKEYDSDKRYVAAFEYPE